jgi:CRISPR-associated protein Csb2
MPVSEGERFDADVAIRVPNAQAINAFDRRHKERHSKKDSVQQAGIVPEIAIGTLVPYISRRRQLSHAPLFDPRWWGEMIVLEIDRDRSELVPKAPAAYLLARALRVMLLGAFGEVDTATEAPPILRARGDDPHCAIVPLPHVWGEHADGLIRGVALLPPHEARAADVHAQLHRLELGLSRCVVTTSEAVPRYVNIPGAGKIWLKLPDAASARSFSLRPRPYLGPSRSWVTVTPIVHSRWRKGGVDALSDQVSADCAHVGLPAPSEIEVLRGAGAKGGADRIVPLADTPQDWRGLLQGPMSHLRITFPEPVRGPVLIGRARHFGLGLCVPVAASPSDKAAL